MAAPPPSSPGEARDRFLARLGEMAGRSPAVRARREGLAHVAELCAAVAAGRHLSAWIVGHAVHGSIEDLGDETIDLIHDAHGIALGFDGRCGELVLLLDYVERIDPLPQGGLAIELETGERVDIRIH